MTSHPLPPAETPPASTCASSGDETVLSPLPAGGRATALDREQLAQALAGRYRVEAELGAGGMGRVFRATDLALERPVALKTILPEVLADPHWIERFRLEATVVAGLQHPGIVQVYEILEIDGAPVLVMEYVHGTDLGKAVDRHQFRDAEIAQVMAEVCDAVAYAHSHGVIHRDIKPANILLTADGVPKVADFGLATHRGRQLSAALERAEAGSFLGSPAYMAPEQARGDSRKIGSRSDVYGLGATLYYALTGRAPVRAATPGEAVDQATRGSVVPPSLLRPTVSRDLEAICIEAMAREAEARYSGADEMARDLRHAISGLRVSARRYGWWEMITRAIAFHREVFAFGVVMVLVMLAGIGLALVTLHGTAKASLFEELRRHVTDLAGTAALMIDPAWIRAVDRPGADESPEAARLTALLTEIDQQIPDIRYLWVMRKSRMGPPTMEFVAVSVPQLPAGATSTGPTPAPARLGQLFDASPFPELLKGFDGPTADRSYDLTDEWGVALSGYAPIRDETGRAIAVLGVDIGQTDLDDQFAALDRSLVLGLALAGILSLAALILIVVTIIGRWSRAEGAGRRSAAQPDR
jgi:adenosine/AMP kinase